MAGAVLHQGSFASAGAAGSVEFRAITPPGWAGGGRLPLVLVLHGADSSSAVLEQQLPAWEALWSAGTCPPAVVGCASTPTVGGFYLGTWEAVVADELPAVLAERFGADPAQAVVTGASMGGQGALRLAFRRPDRFLAVAAVTPAVFPSESPADARPRNTIGVLRHLAAALAARPDDDVVALARANAEAIRRSGLAIRFDCGDDDAFRLQDGAEYLHRVLWGLDLGHDYHLVGGADHVGPSAVAREDAARRFLAAALRRSADPTTGADDDARATAAAFRAWREGGAAGPPPEVDLATDAGPLVLRLLVEDDERAARAADPTTSRRFGVLPPPPGAAGG